MAHRKRRVFQHIMEDRSIRIVRNLLPEQWVVREYRPDYGIDLAVELFEYLDVERTQAATLGETLFLQIKATREVAARELRVYPRSNVEKGPLREDRSSSEVIEVAALRLETSELLTVQAMSPAVPVLLLLVDLTTDRVYFVCLNDLLEKVVLPSDPAYSEKASKVVHVPLRNWLERSSPDAVAILELYAKRPKLYAAFQKFAYQHHELELVLQRFRGTRSDEYRIGAVGEFLELARHFTETALRLDFWTRMSGWAAIRMSQIELENLRDWINTPYEAWDDDHARRFLMKQPFNRRDTEYFGALERNQAEGYFFDAIVWIWHRLQNLGGIFEETVREWFLPTYLSTGLTPDLRTAVTETAE